METRKAVSCQIEQIKKLISNNKNVYEAKRILESIVFLLGGYTINVDDIFKNVMQNNSENIYSNFIIIKNIDIISICEHHFLPSSEGVIIGYISSQKIESLGSFYELVYAFIQEKLTIDIGNTIKEKFDPKSIFVIVKQKHLCSCTKSLYLNIGNNSKFITNYSYKTKEFGIQNIINA